MTTWRFDKSWLLAGLILVTAAVPMPVSLEGDGNSAGAAGSVSWAW